MFNDYGYYVGEPLPAECVEGCIAEPNESVPYWRDELDFTVPRDSATDYLVRSGGYTREEMQEKTDEELAETVLWLACCEIRENGEWMGLCE